MAKRTKVPKQPKKSRSKEEFEFLVLQYQRAFEDAEPILTPQMHDFVLGKAWTRREALEVAYGFMQMALEYYDNKRGEALEYYYLARGIGMAQGAVPEDSIPPEATFRYVPKKFS